MTKTATLLVGPHGTGGNAIRERLLGDPDIALTTASRRARHLTDEAVQRHVSVDLLDTAASAAAFADLADIEQLVFAGYTERATMAETVAPNVAMLTNTLDGLRAAGARLRHVVLVTGGKSYGQHLVDYKTPAKESDPRLLGPLFYNDQEDLLTERSQQHGFTWTVLRPDAVVGFAAESPMSIVNCIGVYATVCKAAGVPLRFPGTITNFGVLKQLTDSRILASAAQWALTAESARNEIFNVTNGDLYRWTHLWPEIAALFDIPVAAPQPMSLQEHMADKGPIWDRLVTEHNLVATPYSKIASWPFADGMFSHGFDSVQSTIKIRQAGFQDCIDSHVSVLDWLERMRRDRLLP